MRKHVVETAEPLPLEIAEWMGLADPPRPSSVEEDLLIESDRRGIGDHLRARLTRPSAS